MLRRCAFLAGGAAGVLGIRREDKNVWERRVPLTPTHVKELLARGKVKRVVVQPSTNRCFSNEEFKEVGATINEDLSEASTIVAVKEVPRQLLIPDRTYLFFSHTIKAQPYNMPLLDTLLEKKVRLIDYERIVGDYGRLVKFGPYAGFAGMIDTLHSLGLALLTRGFGTPFLFISPSKQYTSLDAAREDVRKMGDMIRERGLPEEVCPMTMCVTGYGSVSQAVQQILHLLPCKYVAVEDLPTLWKAPQKDTHNIYVVVTRESDMVVPKDPSMTFSRQDYYAHPEKYRAVFHETVVPYTRVLINGIYWEAKYPRLLTTDQARELVRQNRFPMLCLGDITCDPDGSVEFFVKATTIQNPYYVYNLEENKVVDIQDFTGKGVIVLGVDHLPAEFPKEASKDFADGLLPLVEKIVQSDASKPIQQQAKDLGKEIFGGMVTLNGELTPNFRYITDLRSKNEAQTATKKILVLGGGMVAGPCVRELLTQKNHAVTLLDMSQDSLNTIKSKFAKGMAGSLECSVANLGKIDASTEALIKSSQLVVSLLPATMHHTIAAYTLKHKVPMVTASYISPQMEELRSKAEASGTYVVNEIGLDPGIDIMSTAKMLRHIREDGGIVKKYVSLCGALPQPENSDCPLGYKFSWFPRGVLTAAVRPTRFRVGGQWFDVGGDQLYQLMQPISTFAGLNMEWVPNGNAEKYAKVYSLNDATDVLRGTLRFSTYSPVIRAFRELRFLDEAYSVPELRLDNSSTKTWEQIIRTAIGSGGNFVERLRSFLLEKIVQRRQEVSQLPAYVELCKQNLMGVTNMSQRKPEQEVAIVIDAMGQLGLLSDAAAAKTEGGVVVDSLCKEMVQRMNYQSHERDFVLMYHRVTAFYPKTGKTKIHTSQLALRGFSPVDTATAVTVGLPVGLAGQLSLDGTLASKKGLLVPTDPTIYEPLLAKLEKAGIKMQEDVIEQP